MKSKTAKLKPYLVTAALIISSGVVFQNCGGMASNRSLSSKGLTNVRAVASGTHPLTAVYTTGEPDLANPVSTGSVRGTVRGDRHATNDPASIDPASIVFYMYAENLPGTTPPWQYCGTPPCYYETQTDHSREQAGTGGGGNIVGYVYEHDTPPHTTTTTYWEISYNSIPVDAYFYSQLHWKDLSLLAPHTTLSSLWSI